MNDDNASLIVVGASGWGKEVVWLATRAGWKVDGFLDDNPLLHNKRFYNLPILGTISDWTKFSNSSFIVAIAEPRVRKNIIAEMQKSGKPCFATLVDPSACIITKITAIGEGSVVCAGSVITADVKINKHVIVNKLCSVGHDVILENFVTLAPQVMLGGHVHVNYGAEIGAASSVKQNVRVGQGAMVGMGGLVLKDVEPNSLVIGSPVTTMKRLEEFNA